MVDPILLISIAIAVTLLAWALQRSFLVPTEAKTEGQAPVKDKIADQRDTVADQAKNTKIKSTDILSTSIKDAVIKSVPSKEVTGEAATSTQTPVSAPEPSTLVAPLSAPSSAPSSVVQPPSATVAFTVIDLPEILIHRRPISDESPLPLSFYEADLNTEPRRFTEYEISSADMIIPESAFVRHAQEGRHLFFTTQRRTLVEVWEIKAEPPQYAWLESLRLSLQRTEKLFKDLEHPHDALSAALELVEAYLTSPIEQFREITHEGIHRYLLNCDLEESAHELLQGDTDFGLVGQYLGDHLLFWVVNGHWHDPLRVSILRQRRHEWIAAGIWSQVLHLLGRLVVLAPEARRLHGKAAGTWSQLRGVLRELVHAYLERREGVFPGDSHLPIDELEDILAERNRWPAWNLVAGRRNLWKVVEPLAEVEDPSTRLGRLLAQMRQESCELEQLSLNLDT